MPTHALPAPYDRHWIAAATALGDHHNVIAHRDILAESGKRLVARGTRIDSGLHETLTGHRLDPALEQCVRVEDAVGTAQVRRTATALRDGDPMLGELLARVGKELAPMEALAEIPINGPLAFKLTVARELHPELFRHSVLTTLLTLFLAVSARWNRPRVVHALAAALFHDLGELHLDPQMLRADHRLDERERRLLQTHPQLIYSLLRQFPEYHPYVSEAVLQHHERIDGSGYPQGLNADRLGPIGRTLAVAEVLASRFDGEGRCHGCQGLATILKLNTHKLAPEVLRLLEPVYRQHGVTGEPQSDPGTLQQRFREVAGLLSDWEQATAAQAGCDTGEAADALFRFVTAQMWNMRTQLYDAGLNPREPDALLGDAAEAEGDAAHRAEVAALLDETLWQLGWLAGEVARRWPGVLDTAEPEGPLLEWLARARALADEASPRRAATTQAAPELEDLNVEEPPEEESP